MRYLVFAGLLVIGCSSQSAPQPSVQQTCVDDQTFKQAIKKLADEIDADVKSMGDSLDETRLMNVEFRFRTAFEALPKPQSNDRLYDAWKEMDAILNRFDAAAALSRSIVAYNQAGASDRAKASATEAAQIMEQITRGTNSIRELVQAE